MQTQTPQHQLKNYFDELLLDSLAEDLAASEECDSLPDDENIPLDTEAIVVSEPEVIASNSIDTEDDNVSEVQLENTEPSNEITGTGLEQNIAANANTNILTVDDVESTDAVDPALLNSALCNNTDGFEQVKEAGHLLHVTKQGQGAGAEQSPCVIDTAKSDHTSLESNVESAVEAQELTSTAKEAPVDGVPSILNDVAVESAYIEQKQRLERLLEDVSVSDTSVVSEEALNTVSVAETTTGIPDTTWLENGRPNWAQERFEILLVEVGGLKLAVPLQSLGQIQPMDGELTPLFGQSDWFMGLQKTPMGNVKTVNTAKFVMPERYQEQGQEQLSYVVSINGSDWGLAVDAIDQPTIIDPDQIRWRAKRGERPWMAGTVKDHMCVLLDIPALGEILMQEDKNHPH